MEFVHSIWFKCRGVTSSLGRKEFFDCGMYPLLCTEQLNMCSLRAAVRLNFICCIEIRFFAAITDVKVFVLLLGLP